MSSIAEDLLAQRGMDFDMLDYDITCKSVEERCEPELDQITYVFADESVIVQSGICEYHAYGSL